MKYSPSLLYVLAPHRVSRCLIRYRFKHKKDFPGLSSKFQAITRLLGVTHCRVAQLESRTEEALYKEKKKSSKCFTSQGILEKCASPQRPGVVCLIWGLSAFLSLADWQRGGGLMLQSEELSWADTGFAREVLRAPLVSPNSAACRTLDPCTWSRERQTGCTHLVCTPAALAEK